MLGGPQWAGGKNGNKKVGRWTASLLPPVVPKQTYVEPFCGMLGILFQREPAYQEIVNDLDKHIVAWWTAVRDHSEEMKSRFERTPWSRHLFKECCELLGGTPPGVPPLDDPVYYGWVVGVCITQSLRHDLSLSSWNPVPRHPGLGLIPANRMPRWAERIRRVQLECQPGEKIIERWIDNPNAVIYCDPPYPSAKPSTIGRQYNVPIPPVDKMLSLFVNAEAKVAISGYSTCPWGQLEQDGWHRQEMASMSHLSSHVDSREERQRTYTVWTNYPPATQRQLF